MPLADRGHIANRNRPPGGRFRRSSGILLHPTSLDGPFGIGDLGPEAHRFVDFLAEAGQTLWQVLPLGPTGYGDSPYQCFSTLAGNPLLLSPQKLHEQGLLEAGELSEARRSATGQVDFAGVIPEKMALLERAARRFLASGSGADRQAFESFCTGNAAWLEDFALFMALKQVHGSGVWTAWDRPARARETAALDRWRERLAEPIAVHRFLQFTFFRQWGELREHTRARGIQVMGDVPIYAAHDSADVWANPQYFELDGDGNPTAVAGVPPDYFSATGQLWGNPLYRWDALEADGYSWWLERFRRVLEMVDLVRLDHFRGFEAYWEVPASARTAEHGRWVKGPGAALFQAALDRLGELPLIAENLGVITPEVEAIRLRFGFPGMSILQFAFGNDPQAPSFQPHNFPREMVAYTGTHDCDTVVGWWTSEAQGDSTRSADEIRRERDHAGRYLNTGGSEVHWAFIRALEASVADTVLIPLQDVLGLGRKARMNRPATLGGNWRWRCRQEMLTSQIAQRLRELMELYGR
jgi:4-alpha-glucanotransferase